MWGHTSGEDFCQVGLIDMSDTVDGRNPANLLGLVVCPVICEGLYVPGGCLGFLNHQR